jgi:hypothetical protein
MAQKAFKQEFWSDGISDSDFIGTKSGIISEAVGVDIHDEPGTVKLSKGLVLEVSVVSPASSPPDVLCNFAVQSSNSSSYWFSSSNGKIWERTKTGVWTLVHTISNCSYINGAALFTNSSGIEYAVYSYYNSSTSQDNLAYKPITGGAANWSDAVDTWVTSTSGFNTALWHPMVQQGLYLAIGNGRYLATLSDTFPIATTTFTDSGTPDVDLNYLPKGWEITSIINFDDDILIGASLQSYIATYDYLSGLLLRWDFSASTWTQVKPVQSEGVQAMVKTDNGTFLFSGNTGAIYIYDGVNLEPYKKIRKRFGAETYNASYDITPGSVANYHGFALFGVSAGGLGTEGYNMGIYTLGRNSSAYPMALMCQYTVPAWVSGGSTGLDLVNVQWGAILTVGSYFMASYKDTTADHTGQGVAVMQTTKRGGLGWIDLTVPGDKERSKTFTDFVATWGGNWFDGTVSRLRMEYYAKDYDASVPLTFNTNLPYETYNKLRVQQKIEGTAITVELAFVGEAGTDRTPSLTSFYCEWNEQEKL